MARVLLTAAGGGRVALRPLARGGRSRRHAPETRRKPSARLRWPRRVVGCLLALPLLAMVAISGAWFIAGPRPVGPPRIAGLSAPVEILEDADGVPRIHAANALDAAMALGWVHARDRAFQMEMMRRTASGRLSELAGPATLRIDRLMRTLGLRRRAEADWAQLPADTKALLTAYAAGVNGWLAARGRFAAPELVALGRPEPWSPVDSLLWGKLMAVWLSGNWNVELARLGLTPRLDRDAILSLWPDDGTPGRPDASLAPPTSAPANLALADLAAHLAPDLPAFPAPFTQPSTASDAWVVDGAHSATGAPLLAGDPHLAFGFPSLWYLARIDTADGTVLAGATAPGVPFLVLGHNRAIAWSFTTTGADTEDLFVETVLPDGRYVTPEGPADFTTRQETIRVRGGGDQVITVRETRHGPVISDLEPAAETQGQVLALASAALAPGDIAASGLMALNRAQSVTQAGAAAPLITAPVQNLLVADASHIGLFTTGRVPLRAAGDGAMPVPGGDGAHDWTGFASGEALPHLVDPASGRLVNGNERTAPADFPVFLGRDWFGDWRARRIRTLLDAMPKADLAGFAAMQVDATSAWAQQVLPVLQAPDIADTTSPLAASAAALLRGWDGTMAEDAPQPLIFNGWMQRFYLLAVARQQVPETVAPWLEYTAHLLTAQGAAGCGGDCRPMLRSALEQATASLAAAQGPDPTAWRWGLAHQAVFHHPLFDAIPALARLGGAQIAVPGDDATLFRGGGRPGDFTARHGAEFRGVYDLADLDRSRFMLAPGQSGDVFNPLAFSFLSRWHDGATITLAPTLDAPRSRLRLEP